MFVEALSPLKTSVVDVAVLLLTAIGVSSALWPALWAVDVEVAVASVDHTQPYARPARRSPP
jgi:hypothetical protein